MTAVVPDRGFVPFAASQGAGEIHDVLEAQIRAGNFGDREICPDRPKNPRLGAPHGSSHLCEVVFEDVSDRSCLALNGFQSSRGMTLAFAAFEPGFRGRAPVEGGGPVMDDATVGLYEDLRPKGDTPIRMRPFYDCTHFSVVQAVFFGGPWATICDLSAEMRQNSAKSDLPGSKLHD